MKSPFEILCSKNPAFKELVKKLDLIPISPRKSRHDNPEKVTSKKSDPK